VGVGGWAGRGRARKGGEGGGVNWSANMVASGNSAMLAVHRYCDTRWMLLRVACSQIRCVVKLRKRCGCSAPITSITTSPLPVRNARISNVVNVPDRLRIPSAIAENDN